MDTQFPPGTTVITFESRQADTAVKLIEKYGGRAISAPSMQEVPLEKNEAVRHFGRRLLEGTVDGLVCLTGVGTRMLLQTLEQSYPTAKLVEALSRMVIVARGPKPASVLKEYKIPISLTIPEPNTWREILVALTSSPDTASMSGKRIALQEYGESNEELIAGLQNQGAEVIRVPVYRWELPDDREPLRQAIQALIQGRAQAALFTSRTQVNHLLRLAEDEGWTTQLRAALNTLFIGSVGPVCTETLRAHHIPVHFEPSRPKLVHLIKEAAQKFQEPRQT